MLLTTPIEFYRSVTTASKEKKKSVKTEYQGGIFVPNKKATPQLTKRK